MADGGGTELPSTRASRSTVQHLASWLSGAVADAGAALCWCRPWTADRGMARG